MELGIYVEAKVKAAAEAMPLALVVQSLNVLSMDACMLEEHIQAILVENPLLEPSAAHADNETRDYLFAQVRQTTSLYDDLHQQLGCMKLDPKLEKLSDLLIDCLNEDGYLTEELTQLSEEWKIPLAELENALRTVQSLEPTGVGCRTLSECLRLQLLELAPENKLALDIVTNHLEELASRRFSAEDYDSEELADAMELIRSLSPRPCANRGDAQVRYIVPDIRVFLDENDTLRAELINQPNVPVLSPLYHDYLKAGTEEDRRYIRGQVDIARNFIHSLQMRARTMAQIASFLITEQADFFLLGAQAQKAISLSQLAKELGMNVSTVSRAVAGKYVEYNGKVFPLRELFSSSGSGTYSRSAICRRIQLLLQAEPGLSDSKIAARLEEQGIHISRRTVNKYRNLGK